MEKISVQSKFIEVDGDQTIFYYKLPSLWVLIILGVINLFFWGAFILSFLRIIDENPVIPTLGAIVFILLFISFLRKRRKKRLLLMILEKDGISFPEKSAFVYWSDVKKIACVRRGKSKKSDYQATFSYQKQGGKNGGQAFWRILCLLWNNTLNRDLAVCPGLVLVSLPCTKKEFIEIVRRYRSDIVVR